jgi:hypothetical protein
MQNFRNTILAKINRLTHWQASIVIMIIGFTTYFMGLTNPFEGDDMLQIVNNTLVHSIKNVGLFYTGSTFYNVQNFTGAYYRPLMTTVYSLIYTLFGAHPLYFHLFQLITCIGSAIFLYLFLAYLLNSNVALFLAIVFLLHPIDSQVVYAIPNLQDALFFFFGILGLWLLCRFNSLKVLPFVVLCLFLSMLSKETGICFVPVSILMLYLFDRTRVYKFVAILVFPFFAYLFLRINAVGVLSKTHSAPIDNLDIGGRLLTIPSILQLYITKFVVPVKLASSYYWTHPNVSVRYFILPLLIDLLAASLIVFAAFKIHGKSSNLFKQYIFFAAWFSVGLLTLIQLIPIDMTASEAWFYFSMAGLLGMIGIVLTAFPVHINKEWVIIAACVILVVFGIRTSLRGLDYRSQYVLAMTDIRSSNNDYDAYNYVAASLILDNQFTKAKPYVQKSISIYPLSFNFLNLGIILTHEGEYSQAREEFNRSLTDGVTSTNTVAVGEFTLLSGSYYNNSLFLGNALKVYPTDSNLWQDLALLDEEYNYSAKAQAAISEAMKYGNIAPGIYSEIMNNQPFTVNIEGHILNFKD